MVELCELGVEAVVDQFGQHVSDLEVDACYATLFPNAVKVDAAAGRIQGVMRGVEVRQKLDREERVVEEIKPHHQIKPCPQPHPQLNTNLRRRTLASKAVATWTPRSHGTETIRMDIRTWTKGVS